MSVLNGHFRYSNSSVEAQYSPERQSEMSNFQITMTIQMYGSGGEMKMSFSSIQEVMRYAVKWSLG